MYVRIVNGSVTCVLSSAHKHTHTRPVNRSDDVCAALSVHCIWICEYVRALVSHTLLRMRSEVRERKVSVSARKAESLRIDELVRVLDRIRIGVVSVISNQFIETGTAPTKLCSDRVCERSVLLAYAHRIHRSKENLFYIYTNDWRLRFSLTFDRVF